MNLYLIGLGVNSGDVSVFALDAIKKCKRVILRTKNTKSAQFLDDLGIDYVSLDDVYQKSRNFDTLAKNLAKEVEKALKLEDVCYLVDGSVSEDSSSQILMNKFKNAIVFEGVSRGDSAIVRFKKSSIFVTKYSADLIENQKPHFPLVIFGIEDRFLASKSKLWLSNWIADEAEIDVLIDDCVKRIKLFELDRQAGFDGQTAIFVDTKLKDEFYYDLNKLNEIVKALRAPNGCPWDRAQTMQSIRKNVIEECYELCEAIDLLDDEKMLEELGDVLLQVVFYSVFAEERGAFDINDVVSDICKKLIFRHSHVFGSDNALDAQTALDFWDKNKLKEKGFLNNDYIKDVPKSFPALLRAQKVVKRIIKKTGENIEINSIKTQIKKYMDKAELATFDIGRILMLLCLLSNAQKIDCEEALYFEIENSISEIDSVDVNFNLLNFLLRD